MKKIIKTYKDQIKVGLEQEVEKVLEELGVYNGNPDDYQWPKDGVLIIEFIPENET